MDKDFCCPNCGCDVFETLSHGVLVCPCGNFYQGDASDEEFEEALLEWVS